MNWNFFSFRPLLEFLHEVTSNSICEDRAKTGRGICGWHIWDGDTPGRWSIIRSILLRCVSDLRLDNRPGLSPSLMCQLHIPRSWFLLWLHLGAMKIFEVRSAWRLPALERFEAFPSPGSIGSTQAVLILKIFKAPYSSQMWSFHHSSKICQELPHNVYQAAAGVLIGGHLQFYLWMVTGNRHCPFRSQAHCFPEKQRSAINGRDWCLIMHVIRINSVP